MLNRAPALAAAALLAPAAVAFGPSPASTSPLFRAPSVLPRGSPFFASELRAATTDVSNVDQVDARIEAPTAADPEFDWHRQWYPIVPVEFLDPEKPQSFKLLNIDLVVWNDGHVAADGDGAGGGAFGSKKDRAKGAKRTEGQYRVFEDSCPHRRAPLSEG